MDFVKQIEFVLPESIKDFIFDLHQASRVAQRADEVQPLYEERFKELSDKYFSQSQWPSPKEVEAEVRYDNEFLLFYRSITLHHLFNTLKQQKPQLSDHIEAWNNYTKMFDFVISSKKPSMCLTTQWACDIMQEFVYHFQDFCQFRSQINHRTEEEKRMLDANASVWSLSEVMRILKGLADVSMLPSAEPIHQLLGYFGILETARLECLLGDFNASLRAVSPARLLDRSEIFTQAPASHAGVYYHAGISLLMLRKYSLVIDTLSEIILHITRVLKPG